MPWAPGTLPSAGLPLGAPASVQRLGHIAQGASREAVRAQGLSSQKEWGGQGCSGPSPGPSTSRHARAHAASQKMPVTLGAGDPLPHAQAQRLTSFSLLNVNSFRAEKHPQWLFQVKRWVAGQARKYL